MILAIGDSHVISFHPRVVEFCPVTMFPNVVKTDDITTCWLGPVTAWNFHKRINMVEEVRKSVGFSSNDALVLVAGEIDCRCHIVKQARLQGKTIGEVARQCAAKMFGTCLSAHSMTFWAIPSFGKEDSQATSPYRAIGSEEERMEACRSYNEEMGRLSKESNINFVSLWDDVVKEGHPDETRFLDGTHLVPFWASPRFREKCLRAKDK